MDTSNSFRSKPEISTSRNGLMDYLRSQKTTTINSDQPILNLQETLEIQLPLGCIQALKDRPQTLLEFCGTLGSQ
jgi:hypothetical protein